MQTVTHDLSRALDAPLPSRRLFVGGVAATLAACLAPSGAAVAQSARLRVVATTGMIADAARAILAADGEVTALFGAGVDPHSYRQTRSDIAAMAGADLVLWHGLGLEAQMVRFLADLSRRKPVVAVAEVIPADRRLVDEDYKDKPDPHVWMDPDLWKLAVGAVRDALLAQRPALREALAQRAAAHLAEIDALAVYSRRVLATVPAGRRVLITAHDAFGYFARAYDFEVQGIQGVSTESEAGLQRIRELVDLVVERKIAAIFVESSVSDRNVRALVEGAASRGHAVAIGGELYSDAPGPVGSHEGTYLGMIDHNVTTIARALGGDAPARGMMGRLAAKG
jgi:manganese/zinc/iron transport system substrate-binding protein